MLKKYYKIADNINSNLIGHDNFCPTFIDIDWRKIPYNRISFINTAVQNFKNCRYLEIGCESNICFDSISAKFKIGIDPIQGGNIRTSSDEFFLNNKINFDVIFIDGLHTYEQVRKDVINSIKFLTIGGYIFIHDLTPRNFMEENVPRLQAVWTGDIWRIALELIQTDNIKFFIVNADHGVGFLKKMNETKLFDDYQNLKKLKFKDFLILNEKIKYLTSEEALDFIKNN